MLIPLPLWTYYILRFSAKVQPVGKSVMEAQDRNVSILAETIAGVHVIKAFATEQQEIKKYGANCDEFLMRTLKRIRLFADFQPVIRSIATASHLSLFLVGGILLLRGRLRAGDLMVLSTAMAAIPACNRWPRSTSNIKTPSSHRGGSTRCCWPGPPCRKVRRPSPCRPAAAK
jgi:ATP-binding cassette subfamily B protein